MNTKGTLFRHLISLYIVALAAFSVSIKDAAAALSVNDQSGNKGSTATFTVSVDSAPNEVAAFGFDVRYDPGVLRYRGYWAGSLVSGFDFFDANNASPGTVRIGGFVAGPDTITQGASGTAVSLTFEVVGHDDCQVQLAKLKDGIRDWSTRPGYFTGDHMVDEESSGNPVSLPGGDSFIDIRHTKDAYHHHVEQPNSMAGDSGYSAYSNADRHGRNPPASREEIVMAKNESAGEQRIVKQGGGKAVGVQQKGKVKQALKTAKTGKDESQAVSGLNNRADRSQTGSQVKTPQGAISYSGTTKTDTWYVLAGTVILFSSFCYLAIGLSMLLVGYLFWELIKMGRRQLIAE